MKCLKCNKNMELRAYSDKRTHRFIYECANCGVLELPKPNIKESYFEDVLKLFIECGKLLDIESLNYLKKQNYTYVLYLCNQVIKKFPDLKLITLEEIKSIQEQKNGK